SSRHTPPSRSPDRTFFALSSITLRSLRAPSYCVFFFNPTATSQIYTLALHDALPIYFLSHRPVRMIECHSKRDPGKFLPCEISRSEEHTSELQSRFDLVCRLLLEKKNDSFYARDRTCEEEFGRQIRRQGVRADVCARV